MKQVPRNILEELRARSDIVDIIGAHVNLIQAGSRFKALCPFHHEKTPSFHVNPQMQVFHCFGCGAGGDVFRFMMEHEGVDFMTAVRLLAHRAGLSVSLEEDGSDGAGRSEKDALYRLHEDLTAFYREQLQLHAEAGPARDYLASRDLDGPIAEMYRLGYAPPQPGALRDWAKARKVDPALLVKGGILTEGSPGRGGAHYDRFHGRLMIPIADELGRVIGFTGRVLRAEDSPAKYVNSPETPLFRKSRILFGLDRARKAIVESRRAVLCEGQLDTIRCQTAGIDHTVAAQGTAVTEDHARILARYADEVVLVLDPDTAGRRAALRSAQLLVASGLGVRVALLPDGEDPDSLIRRNGPEAMHKAVQGAGSAMNFLVSERARAGDLDHASGRVRASVEAITLASHANSAVQREQLLREAAELLDISEQALREDFRKRKTRRSVESPAVPEPDLRKPDPPEEIALLEIALESAGVRDEIRHFVPLNRLASDRCRAARAALLEGGVDAMRAEAGHSDDSTLSSLVSKLLVSSRLANLSSDETPPENVAREIIMRLWRRRLEEQRSLLRARVRRAPQEERSALALQGAELTMRIAALNGNWANARAVIEAELDEAEDDGCG